MPLRANPLVVLSCVPIDQPAGRVQGYARYLRFLLEGSLRVVRMRGDDAALARLLTSRTVVQCDLVVVSVPPIAWWQRGWHSPSWLEGVCRCSTSTLTMVEPRYPLRRILLAVQGVPADRYAIAWALELAQASGAAVTLLPAAESEIPSVPSRVLNPDWIFGGLFTNPAIMRQLQDVATALADHHLAGDVRFRSGPLWESLPAECAEGTYDLVVLGIEPFSSLEKRLSTVMRMLETPVLFARSGTAGVEEIQ